MLVTVFVLFYNKIFAVTFDEDFSRATGTNAKAYNLMIAVVIAVIIVLAMNLAGTPVGSTIVAADVAVFLFCYIIGCVKGGIRG